MPTAAPPLFIFAGGGTGGHLFPGLAIAERLRELRPDARTLFLCADKALDRDILNDASELHVSIGAKAFKLRPLPLGPVWFWMAWRRAVQQAREAIEAAAGDSLGLGCPSPASPDGLEARPAANHLAARSGRLEAHSSVQLIAMGGYVAAPAVAAAARLKIPITLVNLDVVPGKANRLIARRASTILSAVRCPHHPRLCEQVVGMPIRRAAVAAAPAEICRQRLGLRPDLPTLLITGASQGAGTLNRLMIDLCVVRRAGLDGWQFLHLTGKQDEQAVREAYQAAGLPAIVMAFYRQMANAWGASNLALSRCGASSVAEAVANAVPTLFSPYPWHKDQHQRFNALPLVEAGLAWLTDDRIDSEANLESLGQPLLSLMADRERREGVRQRLRDRPPPDAALTIARQLLAAVGT